MGGTEALIALAIAGVGMSAYSMSQGSKGADMPPPPDPPPAVAPPPVPEPPQPVAPDSPYDDTGAEAKAKKEAEMKRIAAGRKQTVLTGSLLKDQPAPVKKPALKQKLGG